MKIRQTHNITEIIDLHNKCLPDDEPYEHENNFYWIGKDQDKPCCFAVATVLKDGIIFLSRSGVLPAYRGLRFHRRLIKVREMFAEKNDFRCIITYVKHNNPSSFASLIKLDYQVYDPEWAYAGSDVVYFIKRF